MAVPEKQDGKNFWLDLHRYYGTQKKASNLQTNTWQRLRPTGQAGRRKPVEG